MNVGQCLKRRIKITISYQWTYCLCSHRNFSALTELSQISQTEDATSIKPSSLTSISTSSKLIEKLPQSASTISIPTSHPDYAPNLSYAQLQYLESGQYDIAVHDGNSNLLLKDASILPQFGKYGMKNLSEADMFEWIKQTEHLYRETYRDLMKVDPDLMIEDKDKHLLQFPFDKNDFFQQTQLDRNDIKSWNLLLRVQAHQSHKNYLDSTTDGALLRKQAFLNVLETFREVQNMAEAQDDESEIQSRSKQKMIINIDTYNTMLYAMMRHKEVNMCIELMREMGKYGINPSQQSYIYLIQCFVQKKQVREAHDILKYMKANAESTSNRIELELYNQVIYGYLKLHRKHEAIKVFDSMMQIDGEHPNTKTYTIMMDYYRQTKNVNGAIDLLRECEDRGYKANQRTYNAVILAAAYGDAQDYAYKKMFDLFDEMVVTKEIPPNDSTFSALIVGCGKIGDIESATKCLHLMDKMGIKRTAKVYQCYLRTIANTLRLRKNSIQIGSSKNLKTNDLIRLSEGILKKMQADEELKTQIDINVVNALLSVYTGAQTIDRAMMFYKTMALRFENVQADRQTLRLLWNSIMKSRRYKEAQYIFDVFKANEHNNKMGYCVVKAHMYREMIRLASYFKDKEGVIKYLNMMKERGLNIRSRDKAYLAVIEGTKAEQLEARRRFSVESRRRRKDVTIRTKAKKYGKEGLSFRYWNREQRWAAEKAAGLRNNQPNRNTGKIYWNINKTLGQLDDPW